MGDSLAHVYDAVKRREYYLKTRQLKGRKHGVAVKLAPPKLTRAQRQAQRRKLQLAKIAQLKSRLERLQLVLAAETKKAQVRSGVEPAQAKAKASTSQKNAPAQKLTAAQKAKKAKQDKAYREKNQTQSLDEQVQSLTERIKTIQERIAKMRKNGSVGARSTPAK